MRDTPFPGRAVAARIAVVVAVVGGTRRAPVRILAWDGSEAGPAGAPAVLLRSRTAVRRLLWTPDDGLNPKSIMAP